MRSTERPVGPLPLLALGVNGIVGVGIFFAPADVAARVPGRSSVLVFALTALALLPVALVFARLGRRFDVDGGPVVYARAALGEAAGFAVGWIAYVSAVASLSAVMAGLTAATAPLLGVTGPWQLRLTAAAVTSVLAAIVAAGLAISARTWTTLTVVKLLPLLLLAALFFGSTVVHVPAASPVPVDARSWLSAALVATFALQGFEIVPVIAGRTRRFDRAVPFATITSLLFAAALYVVLQTAAVAALADLPSSGAPLAETAAVLGGATAGALIAAGTSVSALGIAFGMMVTTPHYLAALARGGTLAFGLDRVDERGVPRRGLVMTWLLVVLLVQAGDRGELFAFSSVAVLAQYVVTSLSLVVLCRRRERGLVPRDAWPALPATIVGVAIVSGASLREAAVAAVAVALGFAWRFWSARHAAAPTRGVA